MQYVWGGSRRIYQGIALGISSGVIRKVAYATTFKISCREVSGSQTRHEKKFYQESPESVPMKYKEMRKGWSEVYVDVQSHGDQKH